jgi:8-oxo-dGTP pyrophosphatase MutT (NUDIX family)
MKQSETTLATVVYLITGNSICLAQKKNAIHTKGKELKKSSMKWNGYGGKREPEDVSIRDTAVRELLEESGVAANPENLIPAGRLIFFWEGNHTDAPDMEVFFFFCGTWKGSPVETETMGPPTFFELDAIPYHEMMENDAEFLPKMLRNEKVVAKVSFVEEEGKRKAIATPLDEELVA